MVGNPPFLCPLHCVFCVACRLALSSLRQVPGDQKQNWDRPESGAPSEQPSAKHSRTGRPRSGCSSLPCCCLGCLPVQAAFLLPPHLPLFPLGEHMLIFPGPARSSTPLPSLSLSPGNTDLFSPCGSFQGLKMYMLSATYGRKCGCMSGWDYYKTDRGSRLGNDGPHGCHIAHEAWPLVLTEQHSSDQLQLRVTEGKCGPSLARVSDFYKRSQNSHIFNVNPPDF